MIRLKSEVTVTARRFSFNRRARHPRPPLKRWPKTNSRSRAPPSYIRRRKKPGDGKAARRRESFYERKITSLPGIPQKILSALEEWLELWRPGGSGDFFFGRRMEAAWAGLHERYFKIN